MAIALSGQNIVTSGSGTHTWADVLALGSTNLTTLTSTNGRPSYRWIGIITVVSGTTLNIEDINLELHEQSANQGQIIATGTGIVNIGRKRTVNSQDYYDKSCVITVSRTRYTGSMNQATEVPIAALSCNPADSSQINVYGSDILFANPANISDSNKRIPIYLNKLERSSVYSFARGSNNGPIIFTIDTPLNSNITNVDYTRVGSGGLTGMGFYNSTISLYQESSSLVTLTSPVQNLEAAIPTVVTFYLNALDVYNAPNYDFSTNVTVYKNGTSTPAEFRKLYTHDLTLRDAGGSAIVGALCTYTGRTNVNATSDGSGNFAQFVLSGLETNFGGYSPQPNGYATYSLPITTTNYAAYTREIRSYLHSPLVESISVDSQIGSGTARFSLRLATDAGVTQANTTTVGAYTGVSHTSDTTTVSGTRTLAETYDSRKLYWRNNGGLFPSFNVNVADFGTINVTVSGTITGVTKFAGGVRTNGTLTLASPSSVAFPVATTSGTITLQSAGDYSARVGEVGATGTVSVVDGATNLQGWTFTSGSTITRVSGSAIVTVDSSQLANVTTGTGVTIQAPAVTFTASALTSPTFNLVRCRLSLVIGGPVIVDPSTSARASGGVNFTTSDVNISTNKITIAGIAGKINANTVIRFYGSDLPLPLDSRAVYYPVMASLSGDAVSVSGAIGGAAIDLTDVGSGTDMYADVWIELDNSLITSGSYVVDLGAAATAKSITLASADTLTLQAIHWKGNPSSQVPAISSEYLEKSFAYAGVSLSTLETLTLAQYHNQFCIIDGGDGSQVTQFILDPSTPGKIQLDTAATAVSTYKAATFFYYAQSTQAGMRLLRGNLQILGLNSILLVGQVTLDATNRAVVTGPYTRRADGQSMTAVESNILEYQWTDLLGIAIATEVQIDLPPNIVEAITATLAKVSMLSSGGGGGLDAAGVRSAIGIDGPNLDTKLANLQNQTARIE